METLQLAQMLADLSDLNAADPRAAHAFVNANTTTAPTSSSTVVRQTSQSSIGLASTSQQDLARPERHNMDPSSTTPVRAAVPHNGGSSTPSDLHFTRRFLTPPAAHSSSSYGSVPGTPQGYITDSDMNRASSLMALHELRAKLKQHNDSDSLRQAREKIAALSGRQQPSPQPSTQLASEKLSGQAHMHGRRQ
ncbi:hypothetical protein SEPCBS119000_006571 [Sporothrix epigloea]|uniref:Uncharacterized protein n=1 Tax=Sporothrix epigloea TaxID=1892477 RepID=A0ABP0E421_9PEZI